MSHHVDVRNSRRDAVMARLNHVAAGAVWRAREGFRPVFRGPRGTRTIFEPDQHASQERRIPRVAAHAAQDETHHSIRQSPAACARANRKTRVLPGFSAISSQAAAPARGLSSGGCGGFKLRRHVIVFASEWCSKSLSRRRSDPPPCRLGTEDSDSLPENLGKNRQLALQDAYFSGNYPIQSFDRYREAS